MNILELLTEDHDMVLDLFEDICEEENTEDKLSLFEEIKDSLLLHAELEQKILYPELKNHEKTKDMFYEATEEHELVKKLLQELENSDENTPEWMAKIKVLKENVEHHIQEEENEMFPNLEDFLSESELKKLGDKLQEYKDSKEHRKAA